MGPVAGYLLSTKGVSSYICFIFRLVLSCACALVVIVVNRLYTATVTVEQV